MVMCVKLAAHNQAELCTERESSPRLQIPSLTYLSSSAPAWSMGPWEKYPSGSPSKSDAGYVSQMCGTVGLPLDRRGRRGISPGKGHC